MSLLLTSLVNQNDTLAGVQGTAFRYRTEGDPAPVAFPHLFQVDPNPVPEKLIVPFGHDLPDIS
ncbi:MAG: hypothetical protein M3Z32_09910 [Acidobacteriota bacterium]|nr:hypothetical protein [Acidobacteriota bacterium]